MTHTRAVEIVVGLFVAAGLVTLFMLSMKVSNLSTFSSDDGYDVTVKFEDIGSLKVRSPVTVAGVLIGRVSEIDFDKETYQVVVRLNISSDYAVLPADTSASIYTAGLLGEQYVSLNPGSKKKYLRHGDEIKDSQSALALEQLLGKLMFDDDGE